MSNLLAIATVTATLCQLLSEAAEEAVAGTSATPGRPRDTANGTSAPGINVYLYQAIPNAAWRNADLPIRRADGTLVQHPQAALDLHYLLTFYGSESQLEPQRLLGSAVSVLHAQPVLTREIIRAAIRSATDMDPGHYLAGSDLAEQVETIKFMPLPLNLEELSKLWSAFFQTPYALSVTYQAAVVLIEAEGTPQRALPVREPLIYCVPFRQPVVEEVLSQAGANQPIVTDSTLVIQGRRLRGDVTRVRIGEIEVTPASEDVSEKEISLLLSSPPFPSGSLRAGVQGVQVLHPMMMGKPLTTHRGFESNVAAFVLCPTVTDVQATDATTEVTVTLNPEVGKTQRVVLLLNEFDPPADRAACAYSFKAPPDNGIEDEDVDETASINFSITGVEPGDYLVRVQVDGAESPLTVDTDPDSSTFNRYIDPGVTIG
jgi:hypothetical protein